MSKRSWYTGALILITAGFMIFCCVTLFVRRNAKYEWEYDHADFYDVGEPEIVSGTGGININTADAEELMSLPGIGRERAEDIIRFRDINGGFVSITQLKLITGIGDGIYEKIKDFITIR